MTDDRAQLTTPPIVHKLIWAGIGVLILILIAAEYGIGGVLPVVLLGVVAYLLVRVQRYMPR